MEKKEFVKFLYKKDVSHYKYVWQIEPKLTSLKEWALLTGQDIIETDIITFDHGILQKTMHSMKAYFIISIGQLIVRIRLGTLTLQGEFTHSQISDTGVSVGLDLRRYYEYNSSFTRTTKQKLEEFSLTPFDEPHMTETVWCNLLNANSNEYSTITISFSFEHVYWCEGGTKTKGMGDQLTLSNESTTFKSLDTETLYHSKQLTDFVIYCGDSNFQVHKIVLASRSSVFAAMFEQPLAETLEGKMTISDFEPKLIDEFVKFLYTGNADFATCASELFLLAEKYCVGPLKQLSEQHLINSLNVDNVLDLYKLGKLANSEKLVNNCVETLKRNKKSMFKTAEDAIAFLRDFPCAYEVVFE